MNRNQLMANFYWSNAFTKLMSRFTSHSLHSAYLPKLFVHFVFAFW